jgi:hypothetical protein
LEREFVDKRFTDIDPEIGIRWTVTKKINCRKLGYI